MTPRTRATDPNQVTVTLAGHLAPPYTQPLGLGNKHYVPGDQITITRDAARGLIDAGVVAVDPEDTAAVAAALGEPTPPTPPATPVD